MPGFDQTGPQGAGPMTGRGMGRCQTPQTRTTEEGTAGQVPTGGVVYGLGRGGVPRGGGRGGGGRGTRFGNFRR